ncbi:hypothetical protein O6H91_13G033800 [Diphasiastrum complanatum]|nr:hypothetical protein O6H91_13G033800 [Diphasiastrum complanatum]
MAPGIVQRSTFSWTAEIERHVKDGRCLKAIELFHQMQKEGLLLHKITFLRVLKACTDLALVEEGRRIHTQIVEYGFMADIFVGSCLIDMYSKCRSIEDASRVFNDMLKCDVACWNAMILGYVKCGQAEKALDLFQQMEYEKVDPDNFTFVSVLNACACLEALEEGKQVHAKAIRGGFASDCFVGSSLVDMYSKCGHMEDASKVFYYIQKRSVVCWNAMIIGYVKCGEGEKALELFRQMQGERVELDNVTFMGALNACASTASLEEGRHVHAQIIQSPFRSDMFLGSCLVDMYVKCGSIQDAITAFRNMPVHDVVAWNGMLMGYAMHGLGREALHFFEQMHHKGAERDGTTFVCLLSACSHTGLESEGHHHFESITPVYGVAVEMKHYNCMVDLLSRAGHLCEAEDMINSMPCPPDVSICMTLLGACRTHGNLEIAEHISEQILALDPENASGYVLLSNIYAEAGKWDNTQETQELTM